jgi:hypothetical protein
MGFKHQENPISKRRKTDDRTEGKRKNKENEKETKPQNRSENQRRERNFNRHPFPDLAIWVSILGISSSELKTARKNE